jgi:hypothetical protein
MPTSVPTISKPTGQPSAQPSGVPSGQPSTQPSVPTSVPTTNLPSAQPSSDPSAQPSGRPSAQPSAQPTSQPSVPTSKPSAVPSCRPTQQPTSVPSAQPSSSPTFSPSAQPTSAPSSQPSIQPTGQPSNVRIFVTMVPFLSSLVCDVSLSLLSIYCALPACSDTTWHESNHHSHPSLIRSIIVRRNTHITYLLQYYYRHRQDSPRPYLRALRDNPPPSPPACPLQLRILRSSSSWRGVPSFTPSYLLPS